LRRYLPDRFTAAAVEELSGLSGDEYELCVAEPPAPRGGERISHLPFACGVGGCHD
jgi:hypothetical protein